MPQLRVGFLCYSLNSASTTVLNQLAKEGADSVNAKAYPIVSLIQDDKSIQFAYRPSTIRNHRYIQFNTLRGDAPDRQLMTVSPSIIRDMLNESDVVCLLGLQGPTALILSLAARATGKPLVVITQGTLPGAERKRPLLIKTMKRLLFSLADTIVAQTPATMDTLREVYMVPKERIFLAPWDGGAPAFIPTLDKYRCVSRAELRQEYDIGLSQYVILYTGTVVGPKGIEDLIKAFSVVRQSVVDSRLLIVGREGASGTQAALESLALRLGLSESVHFMGWRGRDELAKLYRLSDVFVLPTYKDMWPKVLVEAALAELPLITTDRCGAAGYVVKTDINGYVYKARDYAELADHLLHLAGTDTRRSMGKRSRDIVEEYLSLSSDQSRQLIRAIYSAAGSHRVPD